MNQEEIKSKLEQRDQKLVKAAVREAFVRYRDLFVFELKKLINSQPQDSEVKSKKK